MWLDPFSLSLPSSAVRRARAAGAAQQLQLPYNLDFIGWGDSRTDRMTDYTLASGLNMYGMAIGLDWLLVQTGGRCAMGKFPNFGISSCNSAQESVLPRLDSANSAVGAGNKSYRPRGNYPQNKGMDQAATHDAANIFMLHCTNDQQSSTPTINVAGTLANTATMIDYWLVNAPNKTIWLCDEHPRGILPDGTVAGNNYDIVGAGLIANRFAIRDGLRKFDRASGDPASRPNVRVLNTHDMVWDATQPTLYRNKAGYLEDGLHPGPLFWREVSNLIHARLIADHGSAYLAKPFRLIMPTTDVDGYTNSNDTGAYLTKNPDMRPLTAGTTNGTFASAPSTTGIPRNINILGQGNGGANTQNMTLACTKGTDDPDFGNYAEFLVGGFLIAGAGAPANFQIRDGTLGSTEWAAAIAAGRVSYTSTLRAMMQYKIYRAANTS
jgi:hypothetical protein